MNTELDFENLVEVLEDQEDMVECKECFDLFPKAECAKQDIGYICPTCGKMSGVQSMARPAEYSVFDTYDQEFPDVQEYDPGTTKDYNEEPKLEDALDELIKDEYEAIEEYEVADEKIQHAPIPEDEKDDILDTLEHIKEEEEEHIDELEELTGEESDDDFDEEDEDDEDKEPEKLEESADLQTWAGYTLDGGEFVGAVKAASEEEAYAILEQEYVETWVPMGYEPDELMVEPAADDEFDATDYLSTGDSLDELLDANINLSLDGGENNDVSVLSSHEPVKQGEEDLTELLDANVNLSVDGGTGNNVNVLSPLGGLTEESEEKRLTESAADETLAEGQLQEGPGRFVKGLAQKATHAVRHLANKDSGKLTDKFFHEGYFVFFEPAKKGSKPQLPEEHKEEWATIDEAITAARNYSKDYPEFYVYIFAKAIDTSDLSPRAKRIADVKNNIGAMFAKFRNGTPVIKKDKEIADALHELSIDEKDMLKTLGKTSSGSAADPRNDTDDEDDTDKAKLEELRAQALKALGEKKEAEPYTPESYAEYSKAFDAVTKRIQESDTVAKLETLIGALPELVKQLEDKLVLKKTDTPSDDDDDEDLEDEDTIDALRKKALEILGEKKNPEGYTEDSYKEYSPIYDRYLGVLQKAKKPETFKNKYIPQLPGLVQKLNDLLKPLDDEDDEDLEDDTAADLEAAKKAAFEKLGDKLNGDGYTAESYDKYIEAHGDIIEAINNCKTVEEVKNIDIDARKAEAEKLLERVTTSDTDNLDELKKKAKADLGEKKDAEPYTEESYTEYSRRYDATINEIDSAETAEDLPDIEASRAYAEKALVEKPKDETPEEDETTEPAFTGKLSELSDVQLARMYAALSGKGVGYADAGQTKLSDKWHEEMNKLRRKLQSLGESFETEDDLKAKIREVLSMDEDLRTTDAAVAELKDTEKVLKSAAQGIKNMTNAMHEEYHKYANPAELTAMDNLRVAVDKIVEQLVLDLAAAGYDDLDYYDSDCYMSGNNSCTITMFLGSEDTFEDGEAEDLQDHMLGIVEEALAQIKLPPELVKVEGGALFPDDMIMDEDDEANGITRGEITVEVTFARKLI